MATRGGGNSPGGAARTPPHKPLPQVNINNLRQSSIPNSNREATASEASQSRSVTQSQSQSHSKPLPSLPMNGPNTETHLKNKNKKGKYMSKFSNLPGISVSGSNNNDNNKNNKKEPECPQDLWQNKMRKHREAKQQKYNNHNDNKKRNESSQNQNQNQNETQNQTQTQNDKNRRVSTKNKLNANGKKTSNTSILDSFMSNFTGNSSNNNNNNQDSSQASRRERRVFDDMDTDESEISEFEVIITPPNVHDNPKPRSKSKGKAKAKSKSKSSRKHRSKMGNDNGQQSSGHKQHRQYNQYQQRSSQHPIPFANNNSGAHGHHILQHSGNMDENEARLMGVLQPPPSHHNGGRGYSSTVAAPHGKHAVQTSRSMSHGYGPSNNNNNNNNSNNYSNGGIYGYGDYHNVMQGNSNNDTDIVIVDDDYLEKQRNSGLGLGLGLATAQPMGNNNNNHNNKNNNNASGIINHFRRLSQSRSQSQSGNGNRHVGGHGGGNNSGTNSGHSTPGAAPIKIPSPIMGASHGNTSLPMAFSLNTSPAGGSSPCAAGPVNVGFGAHASQWGMPYPNNSNHYSNHHNHNHNIGLTAPNSAPIGIGAIKTKSGQTVAYGGSGIGGGTGGGGTPGGGIGNEDYQRMYSGSSVLKQASNESRSDRDRMAMSLNLGMNVNAPNMEREASHSHSHSHSQSENSMGGFPVSMNEYSREDNQSDHNGTETTIYYAHDTGNIKSPLYYNQNSKSDDIVVSKFKHSRPIAGTEYFQELWGIKDGLSIVIPFFNETANELEITLKTLYYSYQYLCFKLPNWEKKPFNVCIIQDGWSNAHTTMQRYLKKMFPKKIYDLEQKMDQLADNNNNNDNNTSSGSSVGGVSNLDGKFWWDYYDEFTKYDVAKQGSTTFIIEKTLDNPTYFQIRFKKDPQTNEVNEQFKGPKYQLKMNLTLIIKIDNRRKHNSHEWFMGKDGFADATHSKYFLATDAFTIFDKKCLYYLVNYMENNPKCCACTGRQRAMSRRQQGLREREWILSMEYILRQTQRCDFELSTCVYNPSFSIFGFLPVIPGPCGMYRCEDALQDEARNWYFDVINASPSETGLVLGNLRIAEDRVLSYASILKLKKTRFMAFVDEAMFYFEAETNLDTFLYQRRRWINGTFAGYWFLLVQHPSHLWNWKASIIRRFFVWFLLWVCLLQMVAVAISPAISFTILQQGVHFLLSRMNDSGNEDTIVPVIMGIVWTSWVAHVIVHNKNKFHPLIMQFLYFLSVFTSLSFAASYFILFVIEQKTVHEALSVEGMSDELLNSILILMGLAAACPIINNFLISADFHGVWVLLRSFFAYFLSFHMMIPWFASYSFARCWDLSWGNRPASEEHGPSGVGPLKSLGSDLDLIETKIDITDLMKAKFLQYSRMVAFGLIVMNFGVYFLPRYWKALLMSGILVTGVLFMILSTLVLTLKFPIKVYERYIEPFLCQKQIRKRLEQRTNSGDDE